MSKYIILKQIKDISCDGVSDESKELCKEKGRKIKKLSIFLEKISKSVYRIITPFDYHADITAMSLSVGLCSNAVIHRTKHLNPDGDIDLAIEFIRLLDDALITIIILNNEMLLPIAKKFGFSGEGKEVYGNLEGVEFDGLIPAANEYLIEDMDLEEEGDEFAEIGEDDMETYPDPIPAGEIQLESNYFESLFNDSYVFPILIKEKEEQAAMSFIDSLENHGFKKGKDKTLRNILSNVPNRQMDEFIENLSALFAKKNELSSGLRKILDTYLPDGIVNENNIYNEGFLEAFEDILDGGAQNKDLEHLLYLFAIYLDMKEKVRS
ncbi:MAG: hypothetical protein PHS92_01865 [Candidatus Gracilibacteria bacterium]|nr:hypothetical protein [Candidatus Gracilibacteria bacterium]